MLAEIKTLRSEAEIDEAINAYELFKSEITSMNFEQLELKDFTCSQFCGSYALDLTIGKILLFRSEYYKVNLYLCACSFKKIKY